MTAAMPGYGTDLPDDLVLGHIAWYTITKPKVTQAEIESLVNQLGLSPEIIPKEPRPGDAFKRACRYSERSGLALPATDHKANFLIRKVAQNTDEVERHLILEEVDSEGKHLEYSTVATLRYSRTDEKLHVAKLKLPDEREAMVVETLHMFNDNFQEALKYIDAQRIRSMIREQLSLMGAIAIRKQGSVYFAPIREKAKTEALEAFCDHMGNGSVFHSIPLPDTSKQREMIRAAFEEEVHEEASQAITELRRKLEGGTVITSRAWVEYRDKHTRLAENYKEYQVLVSAEMSKAEIELEALEKQLANFMAVGLVKT